MKKLLPLFVVLSLFAIVFSTSCNKDSVDDDQTAAIEKELKKYPDTAFKKLDYGLLMYVQQLGDSTKYDVTKDSVTLTYTGTALQQNLVFAKNETFKTAIAGLIPGFQIALYYLPRKSKATIIIPYDLAYGARAMGEIRPFSTLKFEIYVE